jgi:UDP-N-acetylmuramyl pentapeptide synthase
MTGTTPPISIMRGRLIALGIADHAFSSGNTSMLEVSDAFTNLMKLKRRLLENASIHVIAMTGSFAGGVCRS